MPLLDPTAGPEEWGASPPAQGALDGESADISQLLAQARGGDRAATDRLFARVYGELHGLARAQLLLNQRQAGQTLDTTALVHEAYLKMASRASLDVEGRAHFFNLAARVMRHLLVDALRRRQAEKRGGPVEPLSLQVEQLAAADDDRLRVDVLALDAALAALETASAELARLVELRFFAGLPLTEISGLLGRSERTLKRDWRRARAFLLATLERGAGAPPAP